MTAWAARTMSCIAAVAAAPPVSFPIFSSLPAIQAPRRHLE